MSDSRIAAVLHDPPRLADKPTHVAFERAVVEWADHPARYPHKGLHLLIQRIRRSDKAMVSSGWPDLYIAGVDGQAAAVELKVDERFYPMQEVWAEHFNQMEREGDGLVRYHVWTPESWGIGGPICRELARLARPRHRRPCDHWWQ